MEIMNSRHSPAGYYISAHQLVIELMERKHWPAAPPSWIHFPQWNAFCLGIVGLRASRRPKKALAAQTLPPHVTESLLICGQPAAKYCRKNSLLEVKLETTNLASFAISYAWGVMWGWRCQSRTLSQKICTWFFAVPYWLAIFFKVSLNTQLLAVCQRDGTLTFISATGAQTLCRHQFCSWLSILAEISKQLLLQLFFFSLLFSNPFWSNSLEKT